MVKYGHNVEDVLHKYTIDQVWWFFADIAEIDIDEKRFEAIIMANAAIVATPAETKTQASTKTRNWKKFIDSLDSKKLKKKLRKSPMDILSKVTEVPIINIPPEEGDNE